MLLRMLPRLTPARNAAARAASIRRISSEKMPEWLKNEPFWWRDEPARRWNFFSISAAIIVWWWLPGSQEREQLKMMNERLQRVIVLLEAQRAREGRY